MSDDLPTDIRSYHRRTQHAPRRYALGPAFLDWESQPDGFRRFADAPTVALPLRLDAPTPGFHQLESAPPQPVTLESLGLFFELAFGLSAWKAAEGSCWPLRNNPSSGNLHPTEAWAILPALAGASSQAGLHHYAPKAHALETRRLFAVPPSALGEGRFLLALSSILWREAWKYGERSFRYCQLDVGHALGAAAYAAACLGWRVQVLRGPGDAALAALLGLDRADAAHAYESEHPDLIAWVGPAVAAEGEPELDLAALAADPGPWFGQANRVSEDHERWPAVERAVRATHRAEGDGGRLAASESHRHAHEQTCDERVSAAATAARASWRVNHGEAPAEVLSLEPAGAVIRRRRSAQRMQKGVGLGRAAFFRLLAATLPSANPALWGVYPWAARAALALFVHQVEGLTPGLYLLIRSGEQLADLRARLSPDFAWTLVEDCPWSLYFLTAGDLRKEAAGLSCLQAIAGHGAFSLGMLADFDRSLAEAGDWAYRPLHWEAGVIGQALYLEATAAGLSGTGIGCFFDAEVLALLGADPASSLWRPVYHFTVGAAVEDARILTLPAYGERAAG